MALLDFRFRIRRRHGAPSAPDPSAAPDRHYFLGNRYFENNLWDRAVAEWRRATQLWHPEQAGPRTRRRLTWLRAVLALVFTVVLVHQLLFVLFPRDPFEMMMLSQRVHSRSWWEQWLDTGRPQGGDRHKMTIGEWWRRFKQRHLRGEGEEQVARNGILRPTVAERWAELLRRYGRWGPMVNWDLDYAVVSGNGLSRLGKYESAISILEREIRREKVDPKLADLYQGLANAHYYEGYHLEQGGTATYDLNQVRKAAAAYEESARHQSRPLSHGNLGWMYYLLGDYDKSEQHSLKALAMNPNLHYVRLNLGLLYLVQGRLRDAFESYYTVITRNPDDDVYLGGITDLKEVVRDRPGRHPFAYLMIGVLSLKRGDLGEARDALTRYISGPSDGSYWKNLATQLLKEMNTANLER